MLFGDPEQVAPAHDLLRHGLHVLIDRDRRRLDVLPRQLLRLDEQDGPGDVDVGEQDGKKDRCPEDQQRDEDDPLHALHVERHDFSFSAGAAPV